MNCNFADPTYLDVFGEWSDWSEWAECSQSCNAGTQARVRDCIGGGCQGNALERRECLVAACPGSEL